MNKPKYQNLRLIRLYSSECKFKIYAQFYTPK